MRFRSFLSEPSHSTKPTYPLVVTKNSTDNTDSVDLDNPGTSANPIDFVNPAKPPEPLHPAGLTNDEKPDNPVHLSEHDVPLALLIQVLCQSY